MSSPDDQVYADSMKVVLPDPYLIAIGKVCAQWATLENIVDLALKKLAGYDLFDPRGHIWTAHMTWPLKMDVLSSLVDVQKPTFPHLTRFPEVSSLLKKAQIGRNKIIHASWAYENGEVKILRATARGQLKTSMDVVTITHIDAVVGDIGAAGASLMKFIIAK